MIPRLERLKIELDFYKLIIELSFVSIIAVVIALWEINSIEAKYYLVILEFILGVLFFILHFLQCFLSILEIIFKIFIKVKNYINF